MEDGEADEEEDSSEELSEIRFNGIQKLLFSMLAVPLLLSSYSSGVLKEYCEKSNKFLRAFNENLSMNCTSKLKDFH